MIFKLRMLSGETDGFVREYEVPESTDLLQLHDLVCGDLGYDPFNFSSFFAADSGWNKLQEYTLEDMQDCDAGIAALPMEGTRLCDVLASGVSRLIFVFNMLSARELFLEVADFKPEEEAVLYPRVALSVGTPPAQTGAGIEADEENDPFSDMMEEFADFEGTEDDGFGDDF